MPHYFFDTISNLRTKQEMILYDKVLVSNSEEDALVKDFLQIEHETEALNHPFESLKFDGDAALWAAKTVYTACQILLYREHKEADLQLLLPNYPNEISAKAMLSADLCLRFLPQVLEETIRIDPDDALCPILENMLDRWHFSSIGMKINSENIDFSLIFSNLCLQQLYVDRVIERKDYKRAKMPELIEKVKSVLGNYTKHFWKELATE